MYETTQTTWRVYTAVFIFEKLTDNITVHLPVIKGGDTPILPPTMTIFPKDFEIWFFAKYYLINEPRLFLF